MGIDPGAFWLFPAAGRTSGVFPRLFFSLSHSVSCCCSYLPALRTRGCITPALMEFRLERSISPRLDRLAHLGGADGDGGRSPARRTVPDRRGPRRAPYLLWWRPLFLARWLVCAANERRSDVPPETGPLNARHR